MHILVVHSHFLIFLAKGVIADCRNQPSPALSAAPLMSCQLCACNYLQVFWSVVTSTLDYASRLGILFFNLKFAVVVRWHV